MSEYVLLYRSNDESYRESMGSPERALEAYTWSADGTETRLPSVRGLGVAAFGINDAEYIVGHEQANVPEGFCTNPRSRAILWIDRQAFDLNDLVSGAGDVVLTFGSAINSSGQILARGIRTDEQPVPCPTFDFDPETGEETYNDTYRCQSEYAYLLTPVKEK